MVELFWIPLVLQAVVPIGLLLWLAFARQPSHAAWVLTVVLVAFYIRLMAAAGLWLILPAVLLPVYGASLVAGAAVSLWRVRSPAERPRGARAAVGLALRAATVALVAALGVHANGGRRAPGPAVDLAFPLRHGTYLVVNGGSVELINAHIMTLTKDRFQAYRGQSYGVDLVRVSDRGVRAQVSCRRTRPRMGYSAIPSLRRVQALSSPPRMVIRTCRHHRPTARTWLATMSSCNARTCGLCWVISNEAACALHAGMWWAPGRRLASLEIAATRTSHTCTSTRNGLAAETRHSAAIRSRFDSTDATS